MPAASTSQVWLDFDGTISRIDVLDELIRRFAADDSWKRAERQWELGEIGSRECLRQQVDVLRVHQPQLDALVDTMQLDPGLTRLLALLRRFSVPVAIVSDGIERIILRLLARHNVIDLPVRANAVVHELDRLSLHSPHGCASCTSAAAHCKCASIDAIGLPARQNIYVGDGRSDLCPARRSDVVFAKKALARCLTEEHIAFIEYATLDDVAAVLESAWARRAPATLQTTVLTTSLTAAKATSTNAAEQMAENAAVRA